MAYTTRYIDRESVPVQIPDEYSDREKIDAIEFAEASIELDLNDGEQLESDNVTPLVKSAIKQKATCELAKAADDPNSVKLGDLSDEGTNKVDYAESFCDRYDEMVVKLLDSDLFGESTDAYVYNTHQHSN
jgi:hypothetical protein